MAEPIAQGWITVDEAAGLVGYSPAYVRRLAGQGRVEACKVAHGWLVEQASLEAYRAQMEALGAAKHDPWRRDLVVQGRGRGHRAK